MPLHITHELFNIPFIIVRHNGKLLAKALNYSWKAALFCNVKEHHINFIEQYAYVILYRICITSLNLVSGHTNIVLCSSQQKIPKNLIRDGKLSVLCKKYRLIYTTILAYLDK